MVVFDASFVLLLLQPDAKPPADPATGTPVQHSKERIEHLIASLGQDRTPVVVPAPALSEFFVRAGTAATEYLSRLQATRAIKIEPFGERAAVECALLFDGAKGAKSDVETWAKLKFDRQILAITKVVGASILYTTDRKLAQLALRNGVRAIGVHQLDLPPVDPQTRLPLDDVDGPSEK